MPPLQKSSAPPELPKKFSVRRPLCKQTPSCYFAFVRGFIHDQKKKKVFWAASRYWACLTFSWLKLDRDCTNINVYSIDLCMFKASVFRQRLGSCAMQFKEKSDFKLNSLSLIYNELSHIAKKDAIISFQSYIFRLFTKNADLMEAI